MDLDQMATRVVPNRGIQVAAPLRDGWVAIGTFVQKDGSLDLADLTVTAGEIPTGHHPDRPTGPGNDTLGGWLAERRYLEPSRQDPALARTSEPHSIRARLLREVPIEAMRRKAAADSADYIDFGEFLREHGAPPSAWQYLVNMDNATDDLSPERLDYLRAAVAWAARPLNFKNPRAAVRNELGISEQTLTDRLRWAREFGYLTKPGRGRSGGELTKLGAALTARHIHAN
ncbi:MAG: hypothetical protein M3N95_02615 [Actinomycetota bacterium]|nr:hypothetical protein [Actinomycetota bacterium]